MKIDFSGVGKKRHSGPFPAAYLTAACLAGLLCTAGCGGRAVTAPPPAQPAPIINILPAPAPAPAKPLLVLVTASATINPGLNERPAPVVLRLYELRSSSSFDSADFFALLQKEGQVLGADLLVRDEYQLKPGEQLELSRKLSAGVTRVAAMVAFRDLERAIWKTSISIGNPPPSQLRVTIDERRVQLTAQ
jgi:type VI secretion system protein VasD